MYKRIRRSYDNDRKKYGPKYPSYPSGPYLPLRPPKLIAQPIIRKRKIPHRTGEVDPTPPDVHNAPQMGEVVRWNCRLGKDLNRNIAKDFLRYINRPVTLKQASNFVVESPAGLRMNLGIVLNHSASRYGKNVDGSVVGYTNTLNGCSAFLNRAGGTMSAATTDSQIRARFDSSGVLGFNGSWASYIPALYDGFGVTSYADLACLITAKNMNHIWNGLNNNTWSVIMNEVRAQALSNRAGGDTGALVDSSFIPRTSAIGITQSNVGHVGEMDITPLMVKQQYVKLNWINRGSAAAYVDVVVYVMKENAHTEFGDVTAPSAEHVWFETPVGNIVKSCQDRFNAWKASLDTKARIDTNTDTNFTEFMSDSYHLNATTSLHTDNAKKSFMHSPAMRFMPNFSNVRKDLVDSQHQECYREVKRHRILVQPNCTVDETYYCGGFEVNLEKQASEANAEMLESSASNTYRMLGVNGATLVFMCSVVGENIPVKGDGTIQDENVKGMQAAASIVYCEYESGTTIAPYSPIIQSLTLHNASVDIQPTTGYIEDLELPIDQHVQIRNATDVNVTNTVKTNIVQVADTFTKFEEGVFPAEIPP